jgi:serine/threonine-protein kinase
VVIKTPDILQKRDTEYEDYVKQFEAEGRKLAKFSQNRHPHIVSISDFFVEDQVPCLVMDFIQGQTLMEKVKAQGKLSEAECLKYIRQIGSALEAVHQAGMVHRDAHPGNIMIQPNGNAILIDFGIAKEIIPASSSSTDYAANPSFAPYEQIYKGSKANRQPSVDIYALAASFYYAVTGQKPTASMERRLDNRPLKSPKEINPNLSEHLNTAIALGMALEKGDRPQSMSDWLQKLELPPPAVEPQYRQEKVNSPRSVKPEKEPEVAKQKSKSKRITRRQYIRAKLKDIPWGGLIGAFLVYGLSGYILGINSASWLAVAVTAAVAMTAAAAMTAAMTAAAAVAWIWLVEKTSIFDRWKNTDWFYTVAAITFFILPGIVSGITLSIMSGNIPLGIGTGIGTIVIFFALVFAVYELDNKDFSPINIFLILAVTNLSGLGSGWFLSFLLNPKG